MSEEQGMELSNADDAGETQSPLDEMLSNAPPEIGQQIRMMAVSAGMMPHPILAKLNEDHIHKMMDYGESESIREDRQARSTRMLVFAAFVIVLAAVVGMVLFLVLQDEVGLLGQILGGLALFSTGMAGGFGLGRRVR